MYKVQEASFYESVRALKQHSLTLIKSLGMLLEYMGSILGSTRAKTQNPKNPCISKWVHSSGTGRHRAGLLSGKISLKRESCARSGPLSRICTLKRGSPAQAGLLSGCCALSMKSHVREGRLFRWCALKRGIVRSSAHSIARFPSDLSPIPSTTKGYSKPFPS